MENLAKWRKAQKRSLILIAILGLIQLSNALPPDYAIDGTTGIPLGGIGTGAIKFCSHSGDFYGTFKTPCALEDFPALANTQFQFFSKSGAAAAVTNAKMSAIKTDGRADDDAAYPIQHTNFGIINGVSVKDTAFISWDLSNVKLMSYPYAFFQFTVTNTTSSAIDVAIALQASMNSATFVTGKGIKDNGGTLKRAIYAASDDPAVSITAGNDNGFLTSGQCNNTVSGVLSKVAVKVSLAAGQSRLIKFVYAWHNNVTGDEGIHDGMFNYLNDFTEAGAIADTGLAHFDQFKNNAVSLVTRMRKSNLPTWFKNQTLVTLSNITTNSMYRKDGRYAHTEGQWSTNGTMDQMFHSRYIYANLIPSMNWQELKYWARTQKVNPVGQIHHDIDSISDAADPSTKWSRNMAYMCPWDAQQHQDYRPAEQIDKWVDLNAVYILSVYEAFIQTGDTTQLNYFWPSVDKAGKRLIAQLTDYNRGDENYPYLFSKSTMNTYDFDGTNDMSAYNNSLTIPTMKALGILAGIKGDATSQAQYNKYFDSMRVEFPKYYLTSLNFPQKRTENITTGMWEAFFVKFGEMMDSSKLVWTLEQLKNVYKPADLGLGDAGYTEWSEYLIGHFGGTCLQTGYYNEWQGLQYDWYKRIFGNRNLVYNTELGIPAKVTTPNYLSTSASGFMQYISVPVLWRLYYTVSGYFRNKYSNELWVEPIIPSTFTDMNHTMTDAVVFSPEGPATISYKESGTGYKVQDIMFKPDNPITVTNLYVKDKGLGTNYVKINGVIVDNSKITKIGTGFAKELKIAYNNVITTGITVTVSDDPEFNTSFTPVRYGKLPAKIKGQPVFSASPNSFAITTPSGQPYSINLTGLNGRTLKAFNGFGVGTYRFGTSAQCMGTTLPPGIYIVKVKINGAVYPKRFALSR